MEIQERCGNTGRVWKYGKGVEIWEGCGNMGRLWKCGDGMEVWEGCGNRKKCVETGRDENWKWNGGKE